MIFALILGYFAEISGDLDGEIKSRIITVSKSEFHCSECGQISKDKANMWRHIEAKHTASVPIMCLFCNKTCPSRNALASHVSRYHRFKK